VTPTGLPLSGCLQHEPMNPKNIKYLEKKNIRLMCASEESMCIFFEEVVDYVTKIRSILFKKDTHRFF
jgi:hypothetical protein